MLGISIIFRGSSFYQCSTEDDEEAAGGGQGFHGGKQENSTARVNIFPGINQAQFKKKNPQSKKTNTKPFMLLARNLTGKNYHYDLFEGISRQSERF